MGEMVHFGVRGMRWGVRKDRTGDPADDKRRFGARGANRIAKRQAKGKTRQQAVTTERHIKAAKTTALVVYGAFVAKNFLVRYGPSAINSVAAKRFAKAGAKATAEALADSRGLTSYSAINLTFNAAKNVWE